MKDSGTWLLPHVGCLRVVYTIGSYRNDLPMSVGVLSHCSVPPLGGLPADCVSCLGAFCANLRSPCGCVGDLCLRGLQSRPCERRCGACDAGESADIPSQAGSVIARGPSPGIRRVSVWSGDPLRQSRRRRLVRHVHARGDAHPHRRLRLRWRLEAKRRCGRRDGTHRRREGR